MLAALGAFSEGVSDVLVPHLQLRQKAKIEEGLLRQKAVLERGLLGQKDILERGRIGEESRLRSQGEQEKFERESYIPYEDLPSTLREPLGVKPGDRVRKETLTPSVSYQNTQDRIKYLYPRRYSQYSGSDSDLANKALGSARMRVSADIRTLEGSLLTSDEIQQKLEIYFDEDFQRLKSPKAKPKTGKDTDPLGLGLK